MTTPVVTAERTHPESSEELKQFFLGCPEAVSDEELLCLLTDDSVSEPQRNRLFNELYRRYQGKVHRWCYQVVRDRTTATDLAQEVFLKAYRRIGSYRGESRVSTWMFSVTRNHCLTALKRRNADPVHDSKPFPVFLPDESVSNPDAEIELSQLFGILRSAMNDHLNPLESRVLMLHYGHGMPLAALTEKFRLCNRSGAKAYIVSGRRKLKRAIERDELLATRLKYARVA